MGLVGLHPFQARLLLTEHQANPGVESGQKAERSADSECACNEQIEKKRSHWDVPSKLCLGEQTRRDAEP